MDSSLRRRLCTLLLSIAGIYVVVLLFAYYIARTIPYYRLETGGFILAGVALCCSSLITEPFRHRERHASAPLAGLPQGRSLILGYLLALALILLLYWPVLFVGFFYDDYIHLTDVVNGRLELGTGQRFRPTSFLLWRGLLAMGAGGVGLHFLNIALHAANTILTYVVARRLGFLHSQGIAAAAVFMIFPTSVEAVSWMVALPDVLNTTLCLTFLALLPVSDRPRAAATAVAVFLAALCTKETAIAIPAIALAAYGRSSRLRDGRAWLIGGAGMVALLFAVWRITTPTEFDFVRPPSRYLFQKMLSMSAGALAVPWKRMVLDDFAIAAFLWSAAITALFTLYFIRGATNRIAAATVAKFGAWIGCAVAPVYTWFFISPEMEGGRYLYLATPAWSMLLISCIADRMPRLNSRRATATAAVVGGLAVGALVFGVRSSVAAWTKASQMRDGVLAAAQSALVTSKCDSVAFIGLPESIDGAYVFRNGFREALEYHRIARSDRPMVSAADADPSCRYVWDLQRERFQVQGVQTTR
jgi:hypothetical protein